MRGAQESVVASLKASGTPEESLVPVLSNRCADQISPDNHWGTDYNR